MARPITPPPPPPRPLKIKKKKEKRGGVKKERPGGGGCPPPPPRYKSIFFRQNVKILACLKTILIKTIFLYFHPCLLSTGANEIFIKKTFVP